MCDYAILAGNEKSSGRHKVKHKTMGQQVCFAVMSLHSHACHRLESIKTNSPAHSLQNLESTPRPTHSYIYLIHKSTRNNIFFFLPEIHSFLFFGNS